MGEVEVIWILAEKLIGLEEVIQDSSPKQEAAGYSMESSCEQL